MDLLLLVLSVLAITFVMLVTRVLAFAEARHAIPDPDVSLEQHPGFHVLAERNIYGMRLTELVDRADAFSDFVEIGCDGAHNFTRVTISFPTQLKSGIHLALEAEEGFFKRLMNMKETRVGHDHFDSEFIVLAASQSRAEKTLTDEIRSAMLEIRDEVDELRVTDESVFARIPKAMSSEELDRLLPRIQAIAHAYYERAKKVEEEVRDEAERNPEIPNPQREGAFGITGRYTWQYKK
ncbi:MAG: hypothetical protein R3E66_08545 [bacterium]